jgi:ribulose-5-phosphate 4-epimerase/fuculose-1-phosphate aldolase
MSTVRKLDTSSDPVWQARVDLAAALRIAKRFGWQDGMGNHFSMVVPGQENLILLNPYGYLWQEVRASMLTVIDTDGNHVEGEEVHPTARWIHACCHKAHKSAKVCLHTHAPYSTALTMIEGAELEFAHQGNMRLWGKIAWDREYNGIGDSKDEGDRLAKALGGGETVLFMAAHGVITVGETVAAALHLMHNIETLSMRQLLAQSAGKPLVKVREDLCQMMADRTPPTTKSAIAFLEAHKRILDREEPDYAT